MKVERPYAFCCIEGGGRISGCSCSNPDHGTAIVDVRAPLVGDKIVEIDQPQDTAASVMREALKEIDRTLNTIFGSDSVRHDALAKAGKIARTALTATSGTKEEG